MPELGCWSLGTRTRQAVKRWATTQTWLTIKSCINKLESALMASPRQQSRLQNLIPSHSSYKTPVRPSNHASRPTSMQKVIVYMCQIESKKGNGVDTIKPSHSLELGPATPYVLDLTLSM